MNNKTIYLGIFITLTLIFVSANSVNATYIQGGGQPNDFIQWELRTFNETENGNWQELDASDEFYNKLSMNEMTAQIEDDVGSKTNLELHHIYLTIYEKPNVRFASRFFRDLKNAAEKTNYNGVIIYWLDYGVWGESYSLRLSEDKLAQIKKAAWVKKNKEGERAGIKYLLKEVSKQLSTEIGRECDPGQPKCGALDKVNCNPVTEEAAGSYVCCPGSNRWNGEKCIEVGGSSCGPNTECPEGMNCNSADPRIEKHCCPEGFIWLGDNIGCKKGRETDRCEKDNQCEKRGFKQARTVGLYCNPTLEGADYEKGCCPKGHAAQTDPVHKCVDKRGTECENNKDCDAGMECFSAVPVSRPLMGRHKMEKGCCPENKVWNEDKGKCVKSKKGQYCKRDKQCKGSLKCNYLAYSNNHKVCCPKNKAWVLAAGVNGECVKREGIPCGEDKKCPGDWKCTQVNKDVEKGCCPPGKYWTEENCVPKGGEGFPCEKGKDNCNKKWYTSVTKFGPDAWDFPGDVNCNPTFGDTSIERACCTGNNMWNGEECVETKECEDNGNCKREGYACNSIDPSIDKHCCRADLIWNGESCAKAYEGDRCKKDDQCQEAYGLSCYPKAGDWEEGVCCHPGEMYDSEERECTKLDRGEKCPSSEFCKDTEDEDRNCNPSKAYISQGKESEEYCCVGNQVYDSEEGSCTYLEEGDECISNGQCKSSLNCYPTISGASKSMACCSPGERWDGQDCVSISPHHGLS